MSGLCGIALILFGNYLALAKKRNVSLSCDPQRAKVAVDA
jgi:hypothetical protein